MRGEHALTGCGLMLILLLTFESVTSLIRTVSVSLQEIVAACFLISLSGCEFTGTMRQEVPVQKKECSTQAVAEDSAVNGQ